MPPKKTVVAAAPVAVAAAPVAVAPVVAPVAPVAAPVPDTTAAVAVEVKKPTRERVDTVIQLDISHARCATHLRKHLDAKDNTESLKKLRARVKDLSTQLKAENLPATEHASLTAQVAELQAKITAQSKETIRISGDTPIAIATIWDYAIKELLEHAISAAARGGQSSISMAHVHEPPVDGTPLVYAPLYNRCKSWLSYSVANENVLQQARAAQNKLDKERRAAKKAAEAAAITAATASGAVPTSSAVEAAVAAAAVATVATTDAAAAAAAEDESGETTFITYVDNAYRRIRPNPDEHKFRISFRVREHLSDLISEGIERIALLSRVLVTQVDDVRTMSTDHVKAVANILVLNDDRPQSEIDEVLAAVSEKLTQYKNYNDAERSRKEAELSDEKRADQLKKKQDAALEQKKRSAAALEKKAAAIAETLAKQRAELVATA